MLDTQTFSLEELKAAKGWQARYSLIMLWGKNVSFQDSFREANNLVKGCESPAWIRHISIEKRHYVEIDSDSKIVKGLGVLISLIIQGKTKQEVQTINFEEMFEELGFKKHLSPSRGNGLKALLKQALGSIENN